MFRRDVSRLRAVQGGLRGGYGRRIGLNRHTVIGLLDDKRLLSLPHRQFQLRRVERGQHIAGFHPVARLHVHRADLAGNREVQLGSRRRGDFAGAGHPHLDRARLDSCRPLGQLSGCADLIPAADEQYPAADKH